MVSRQAAAVLRGVGLDRWICRDGAEMVERALSLANNRNGLEQQRLQQRQQVAGSELLDHAGLAASLEGAFRSWWLRWLQQQGWPIDAQQQAWPASKNRDDRTPLTPITNSVCKRLPLWLGSLPDAERQRREAQGQHVVRLQNLQPWGEAVHLFAGKRHREVLAWLETGASAESQRWWQHTYPQLVWEPTGPLAPR